MATIIECVPNFSEGRNRAVLTALEQTAKSVPGVSLLDFSGDKSHNRSVYTLVGSPKGIEEAAFALCKTACELIDLRHHSGEHPRMGATDVIPFIPLSGATMEQCVQLSKRVGERIYEELKIPVYLYEESACAEYRRNLASVRRGEFEGLREKMKNPDWVPDFGNAPHISAGAVAVGARAPLIAFNINLDTPDKNIASEIAKTIRFSSGGYKYCKAIGVFLEGKNAAQVSINMTNYAETPLYRIFNAVAAEAERRGVKIIGSEIIGLSPARALIDSAVHYLKLDGFDADKQVLDFRIGE